GTRNTDKHHTLFFFVIARRAQPDKAISSRAGTGNTGTHNTNQKKIRHRAEGRSPTKRSHEMMVQETQVRTTQALLGLPFDFENPLHQSSRPPDTKNKPPIAVTDSAQPKPHRPSQCKRLMQPQS